MNPYVSGEGAWQRIQERLREAENRHTVKPAAGGVHPTSVKVLGSEDCPDCDQHEEIA